MLSCLVVLCLQLKLVGRLAQQMADATQGMVTRAVPLQSSLLLSAQSSAMVQAGLAIKEGQSVHWNQRFVLALPADLSEQLLTPAPGDNPWDTTPLELQIEVWDGSGEQGLGRMVTKTRLQVTYSWLLGQVQALLTARQAAAAATTSITAAAGDAGKHRRTLSTPSNAAAAAAAEKIGKTYLLDLKADGNSSTADDSSALMQLTVGVSLDDSQVSSSWYPHQRLRRQLAHLVSLSRSDNSRQLLPGSGTSSSKPGQAAPSSLASAAGSNRHALRLEGSDMWSPFSYSSLRRLTGSLAGPHTGIVPIRAGQGLVLELSYTGVCHWRVAVGVGSAHSCRTPAFVLRTCTSHM